MSTWRRLARDAGAPVRAILLGGIAVYRMTLSGWLGGQCRFHPSCSVYAADAIRTRGAARGSLLAVWRVLRCNPFGRGGFEPISPGQKYDAVTRPAGGSA